MRHRDCLLIFNAGLIGLLGILLYSGFRLGGREPAERFLASNLAKAAASARAVSARMHSHNDYEQNTPLFDALANRFASVEADIWMGYGVIEVSHLGLSFTGSLRGLYLDPLQKLVDARGSVYGDGKPFYLWLDIKDRRPGLAARLLQELDDYPMFARFSAAAMHPGTVVAILTGFEDAKQEFMHLAPSVPATRDRLSFLGAEYEPDARVSWYTLNWQRYFAWEGDGEMPDPERRALQQLVTGIHSQGRRLRFWNTPETEGFWRAADDAGVDLIGTDELVRMSAFLARRNFKPEIDLARQKR
jgi:hypothetical protein